MSTSIGTRDDVDEATLLATVGAAHPWDSCSVWGFNSDEVMIEFA